MNLENIMLNEIKLQRATCLIFPLMYNVKNWQIHSETGDGQGQRNGRTVGTKRFSVDNEKWPEITEWT